MTKKMTQTEYKATYEAQSETKLNFSALETSTKCI